MGLLDYRTASPHLTIVLYNYVQPNERNSPGGGVTVYLKNVSASLRDAGHRVYILSGGDRYGFLRTKPRLVRISDDELIIYNSPVIAPAIYSFYHPEFYLQSKELDTIPARLLREIGPIDVFHFHNIEGLTQSFFHVLRDTFRNSALIFSAHNYNIGCAQVNLWQNTSISCKDFHEGAACINCSGLSDKRKIKLLINRLKTPIKELGERHPALVDVAYSLDQSVRKLIAGRTTHPRSNTDSASPPPAMSRNSLAKASIYRAYRLAGTNLINDVFDRTIAVSKRTADILISFGAKRSQVTTCYIGTKHSDRIHSVARKVATPDNLHIGYLGYMREEKGFFLLLNSLDRLPASIKSLVDVTIAAKFTDVHAVQTMQNMAPSFRTFNIFDGYTHTELADILTPVNLGIVPPLWEDNLPQVAIEFVAHGIPILTSNMGGAQEIASNPEFVFDISDPDGLVDKIQSILHGDLDVSRFWAKEPNVRSNVQHMKELVAIYQAVLESRQQKILHDNI